MKAVIMAGGEGSRLRPITCACPKPMVPVLDKPVMQYALELLTRHGIEEAVATLLYLPERITDYFADGSEFGLKLFYRTETSPMGTAGSVRAAADFLDEPFVVLSGDGLTDCDLTDAYRYHREKGALATMVLKRVKNPLEYGVVCTDASGRVTRFVEKPGWGEVCSDAVNTGIYILEPEALLQIPENKNCDFGRELFPKMVERGLPVFGYPMDGYWCDIGDTASYLRAQTDLLDGKMRLSRPVSGRQPGASVDPSAILESPFYIGAGARVEPGARVGPYAVLGVGSVVGANASVKRSALLRGAQVGERAQLRGCVLCAEARIDDAASAFEESVLGEGARLGQGAVLMPGVRVWPHKEIEENERIDQNVVWGRGAQRRLIGGMLPTAAPAQVVRDAQAYVEALSAREILVARDESAVALACARAAVAGLMAQGAQVIDIGAATLAQLRHAQRSILASGALYIGRDGLLPLGALGGALSRDEARALALRLSSEDYAAPFSGVTRPPIVMGHTELLYVAHLLEETGARFDPGSAPQIALHCPREQVLSLCEGVFRRAGCAPRAEWEEELMELSPSEIGVWLSENGETARFADAQGLLSEAERVCLLCYTALEMGADTIILPHGATRSARALCDAYGARLEWIGSDEASFQKALLKQDRLLFDLFFDGVFASLAVVHTLYRNGLKLREPIDTMPKLYQRRQTVPIDPKNKGRLLRLLSEAMPEADASDGLTLEREGGWAWIGPCGDRRECVVVSEAADAEIARELCDFCLDKIEKIMRA